MLRALFLAGVVALTALPVTANPVQLARAAGVEPGKYSIAQMIKLIEHQRQGGGQFVIRHILENPEGGTLVPRLSTSVRSQKGR